MLPCPIVLLVYWDFISTHHKLNRLTLPGHIHEGEHTSLKSFFFSAAAMFSACDNKVMERSEIRKGMGLVEVWSNTDDYFNHTHPMQSIPTIYSNLSIRITFYKADIVLEKAKDRGLTGKQKPNKKSEKTSNPTKTKDPKQITNWVSLKGEKEIWFPTVCILFLNILFPIMTPTVS